MNSECVRWIEASDKYMRLRSTSRQIAGEIGGHAYFVGSALTSETRPRDVDVRIVLEDEAFAERYKISVKDWQWEARLAKWSEHRWNWHHEQARYGIMIAGSCGERTIDLGIIPASLWIAVYANAPHEDWGSWLPEIDLLRLVKEQES